MPTSFGILLRSGLFRSELPREDHPSRRPFGPKYQDGERSSREVESWRSRLQPSAGLLTRHLSPATGTISSRTYAPGLWTRYGQWDASGTKLFNQRGELIYELPTTA